MKKKVNNDRDSKLRDLDNQVGYLGKSIQEIKEGYMEANYLGVNGETPIYRIFPLERFLQLLQSKKLVLVKPKLWEDPYENFFLNSKAVFPDGMEVSFESMREQYYGQCWSLEKECDGLWRTYSQNYTSIKVKSTVSKLMNCLYDIKNPFHTLSYFIGKVEYVKDDEIANLFNNITPLLQSTNGLDIIKTLLTKREAFKYENEVRLLFKIPQNDETDFSEVTNMWSKNHKIYAINVEPNNIIDEVIFHPRMSKDLYCSLKQVIKELGFDGIIDKSTLYDEPTLVGKFT
jgi:hypothetical protein